MQVGVCVCVLQIVMGGSFTMASERNPSRQLVCLPFSNPSPIIKLKLTEEQQSVLPVALVCMWLLKMLFGLNSQFHSLHYQRKYMHPVLCMERRDITTSVQQS